MRVSVAVAVVVSALIGGCDQPQASSRLHEESGRADPADLVIRELTADPQFVWFSTLKRLYPSDYEEVGDALRTQITDAHDIVAARIAMGEAVEPIMLRHKDAARLASDKQLVEYLRRNTRVAEALAGEDVKACNDVFQGSLDPRTELPDSTWKLMSEATAQLLVAAKDGETTPNHRSENRLSQADYAAWRIAMEKVGADADTFDLITNPERKATANDQQKCHVRIQMMKGALGLPQPLAAKITLSVL